MTTIQVTTSKRLCTANDCDGAHFCHGLCQKHHQANYYAELKLQCLLAYGGPVCVGCSIEDISELSLHHVDGGGNDHRRLIGIPYRCSGRAFYQKLRELGYPQIPQIEVLCRNCHKHADRELRRVA